MKAHATTIAAAALVTASFVYAAVAGATGHSARAEPPPDLSTTAVGLDPMRVVAWMLEDPALTIVDVRPEPQFNLHHLPGAENHPQASASEIDTEGRLLIVAANDNEAAKLVGEITGGDASKPVRFLEGGAPAWYLAFELPIPLFNAEPPPRGWEESRARVRSWLANRGTASDEVRVAVEQLAAAAYEPTDLGTKKKPKSGGKKKKISGGCG